MDIEHALALLGGMSPRAFMRRHWQKKPLLIRRAVPDMANSAALLGRSELFALAAQDEVESRLVQQRKAQGGWSLRQGPFQRRSLPSLSTPQWTLLVQGVDLHMPQVRDLLDGFRFVPDARLDDVMVSFATPGGGVGPHFDSYDVFLLQARGTRRWHIGKQKDLSLQAGAPLKILQNFVPEQSFDLAPGDMLYLPPRYAHEGVALDECMTYSIGFRAPRRDELARELLQRLADDASDEVGDAMYRDAGQVAVATPAEIPQSLLAFAQAALRDALANPETLARALGESLSEPKSGVWFDGRDDNEAAASNLGQGIRLDRRCKMLFDAQHVFINGESFVATGRDAVLMRQFANQRHLDAVAVRSASKGAKSLLQDWMQAGWIHGLSKS